MKNRDDGQVSELQGLYGPLQILEDSLQRVWALQRFERGDWRTDEGERIRVRHLGKWNRGKGPDFQEAELEIGGEIRSGDIEIHLYREDWYRHGHHLDPAYNRVILHISGFKGGRGMVDRALAREDGQILPEWWAGPWVTDDWEILSSGNMGLLGEHLPELMHWVEGTDQVGARREFQEGSQMRWESKVRQCGDLLCDYGWAGSLLRLALYTLGYPENRGGFLELADRLKPEDWSVITLQEIVEMAGERIRWKVGRPANHADRRLGSLLIFARSNPDWLDKWEKQRWAWLSEVCGMGQSGSTESLSEYRKRVSMPALRKRWEEEFRGVWKGGTIDRLLVDVLLPLLAGAEKISVKMGHQLWNNWYAGAIPQRYRDPLKVAGIGNRGGEPMSNGSLQGIIWKEEALLLRRLAGGRA